MAALGLGGRADAEHALARQLAGISPDQVVAGYLAHGSELSVLPVLEALAGRGVATCVPLLRPGQAEMHFAWWRVGEPLEAGPFGLTQPPAGAPLIEPSLILAPLLGFDRKGGRIGQGQGFYDRAFAQHPQAVRIGVAWSVQEVDEVPMDPWDVPLHAVLTEAGWLAGEAPL